LAEDETSLRIVVCGRERDIDLCSGLCCWPCVLYCAVDMVLRRAQITALLLRICRHVAAGR